MKTVAIIAGGKSPEHDVSVISARNIYNALDSTSLFAYRSDWYCALVATWYHLPDKALFAEGLDIGNRRHPPIAQSNSVSSEAYPIGSRCKQPPLR
jgi:hypothetical protein